MNKFFILAFLAGLTCIQVSLSMELNGLEKAIQKTLIQDFPRRPLPKKHLIAEPDYKKLSTLENQCDNAANKLFNYFEALKNENIRYQIQSCVIECARENKNKLKELLERRTWFSTVKEQTVFECTTKLPEGCLIRIDSVILMSRKPKLKELKTNQVQANL